MTIYVIHIMAGCHAHNAPITAPEVQSALLTYGY